MDEQPAHGPPQIRVLAVNLPQAFDEVLRQSLSAEPSIRLRWFSGSNVGLLLAARDTDILLIGAPQPRQLPAICTTLLAEFDDLRVIVVDADGAGSRLYWLGLRARWLGTLQGTQLRDALTRAYNLNQVE